MNRGQEYREASAWQPHARTRFAAAQRQKVRGLEADGPQMSGSRRSHRAAPTGPSSRRGGRPSVQPPRRPRHGGRTGVASEQLARQDTAGFNPAQDPSETNHRRTPPRLGDGRLHYKGWPASASCFWSTGWLAALSVSCEHPRTCRARSLAFPAATLSIAPLGLCPASPRSATLRSVLRPLRSGNHRACWTLPCDLV